MATRVLDGGLRIDFHPHLGELATLAEGVFVGTLLGATAGVVLSQWLAHHLRLQNATIRGHVTCAGVPAPGAEVVLVGEYGPGSGAVYSARAGRDGAWSVDVAPGMFSVTVQPDGRPQQIASQSIVQVDAGGTALSEIALPAC